MKQPKLKDLLKTKKVGDEWHCFAAPEETKVWTLKNKWRPSRIEDEYGLDIRCVTVHGSGEGDTTIRKFTRKSPFKMRCGVEVFSGYSKSTTSSAAKGKLRVDSVRELNYAMEELSDEFDCEAWDVKEIEAHVAKFNTDIYFKVHNPDGTGASLYFYSMDDENGLRYYPEVGINEQFNLSRTFAENMAHCTAEKPKDLVHGCNIERLKRIKAKKGKTSQKIRPGEGVVKGG